MKNRKRVNFRILVVVGMLVSAANMVWAQQQETSTERRYTPKLGIKGGVNFSNLYVSNVQNENLKMGVSAGIFAKLPVTKGISLQPELLYTNKGAKDTYSNFAQGSGQYRFNLNYVEAPLLLVFNLTRNFNLQAGAYASYLVSANVKDMRSDGSIAGVHTLNADSFNRVDFGLAGGLGFDFEKATVGARYNYGLQNVGKPGTLSGNLTQDSKNSVATLFIGFAF